MGNDEDNKFYQSWHMPSTESPYQDKEVLEMIRKSEHPLVWREEYLAEFLSDGGGVFSGIDDAASSLLKRLPEKETWYVAGVDWGLDDDYTVFTVLDARTRAQVFALRFRDADPIDTVNKIARLIEHWQPRTTVIEKNGMGKPLFQMLKKKLTDTVLRGLHLDNALKRELVEEVSLGIAGAHLKILSPDQTDLSDKEFAEQQISEMSTFERKRTAGGLQVTYSAAEGYHDDCVMALGFAYSALPKIPKFVPFWKKKENTDKVRNPFKKRTKTTARRKGKRRYA
jgi:hypothetical protein